MVAVFSWKQTVMVVLPAAPELGEMEVTQVALSEAVQAMLLLTVKSKQPGELETLAVGGVMVMLGVTPCWSRVACPEAPAPVTEMVACRLVVAVFSW